MSRALEVVAGPEPTPEPLTLTFRATEGAGGPDITDQLVWRLYDADDTLLVETTAPASGTTFEQMPGDYRVEALRPADEQSVGDVFNLADASLTVTLVFAPYVPPATVSAPDSAPAGSLVAVTWSGPDLQNDYVATANLDMSGRFWIDYSYLRDGEGQVAMLRMRPEAGTYEIRYILSGDGNKVLARREIEITPLDIAFDAPAAALVGSVVPVGWVGPGYENDFITVARPDQGDAYHETYEYIREGNPLSLSMPTEPGRYELRYVLGASRHVAGRTTIEVTDVTATLQAPDSATAGSALDVTWSGPGYDNDYIAIAAPDSRDNQYVTYEFTREGNPLAMTVPVEPGEYQLRYVMNQDRRVLARRTLLVEAVGATLTAPPTIAAGGNLDAGWTGPGGQNDYVAIAAPDARPGQYEFTRKGETLALSAPNQPGEYVLRYVQNGDARKVLAQVALRVTAVTATLSAAPDVAAGGELSVAWTGPGGQNDYVAIAAPDVRPGQYETYEFTRKGDTVALTAPNQPGEYVLRYVQSGNPRVVLAEQPLLMSAVSATLEAAREAPAGFKLDVAWSGPGYRNDYIAIAAPDAKPGQYETYEFVRKGSPMSLSLPDSPGEYELRFVLAGSPRVIIARQTLLVVPEAATLEAPDTAAAGSVISVTWTGPAGEGDYLALAEPGAKAHQYAARAAVRDGSPASLTLPASPGAYELRYVMSGIERQIIATRTLTVE